MIGRLTALIDKHQSTLHDDERNYIGASSIGNSCMRAIWYQYNRYPKSIVNTKLKRTRDIGKILETLIVSWLLDAGFTIERNNITYADKTVPMLQGHFDGILTLRKKKYVLEIKTAKDSSFGILVKKGVKIWSEQYYAQVQAYMGMSGIKGAYIIALNKDTSELYDESIDFDAVYYEKLVNKANTIATAATMPTRISGSPLWWQCKMCQYNKGCHK